MLPDVVIYFLITTPAELKAPHRDKGAANSTPRLSPRLPKWAQFLHFAPILPPELSRDHQCNMATRPRNRPRPPTPPHTPPQPPPEHPIGGSVGRRVRSSHFTCLYNGIFKLARSIVSVSSSLFAPWPEPYRDSHYCVAIGGSYPYSGMCSYPY